MNHLDIHPTALTQIRNLYDHRPPPGPLDFPSPPRTARALGHLSTLWDESRQRSEAARVAQLDSLERFVVAAHDVDSQLSHQLGGGQ